MAESQQKSSIRTREEWVTVAEYTSPHEAGIAKGQLESAGIASILVNETMIGMFWHLSNAVGGVRVKVSPSDEQEARALLAESFEIAESPDAESMGPEAGGYSSPLPWRSRYSGWRSLDLCSSAGLTDR